MFGRSEKVKEQKSLSTIASAETAVSRHDTFHPPGRYNTPDSLSQAPPPPPPPTKMGHHTPSTLPPAPAPEDAYMPFPAKAAGAPRLVRVPTTQTRYMEMLLHLDQIPRSHNIFTSACTWIVLAGFLVVPGTFTSFKDSAAFQDADADDANSVAHAIVDSIANVGLLWLSGACCAVGGIGCLIMWFRWRHNYVWLLNRIFLPVSFNAAAGLLTTLVNVYTARGGVWSRSAKIAGSITGGLLALAGSVFLLYNFWALERVRDAHEREFDPEAWERKQAKKTREGLVGKLKRKLFEKPSVPGKSEA